MDEKAEMAAQKTPSAAVSVNVQALSSLPSVWFFVHRSPTNEATEVPQPSPVSCVYGRSGVVIIWGREAPKGSDFLHVVPLTVGGLRRRVQPANVTVFFLVCAGSSDKPCFVTVWDYHKK